MDDRPGSSSQVRTSDDKVCKKDWYWPMRAVYVLEKQPDVPRGGGILHYGAIYWQIKKICHMEHLKCLQENILGVATPPHHRKVRSAGGCGSWYCGREEEKNEVSHDS